MTEIQPIDVKPFDNEISILYKWAQALGLPAKYIAVRPATADDIGQIPITGELAFEPLSSIVVNALGDEVPTLEEFRQIYDQLQQAAPHLSFNDLVLLIYSIATGKGLDHQEIFNLINQLYVQLEVERKEEGATVKQFLYPNLQNLDNAYAAWFKQYQEQAEKDAETLNEIIEIQDVLDQTSPLQSSPITINGVTVRFSPTIDNRQVKPNDGIDIFNASILSTEVPYIQYNGDSMGDKPNQKYYKIFRGDATDGGTNYANILPSPVKSNQKNMLYITVLVESEVGKKLTKESYQYAIYDIGANRLFVSSPISENQNEALVVDRIKAALPNLNLGPQTEVKVRGEFNLYNLEINDYSLYDIILNDDVFKTYLFVNETNESYPNKKRLGLQYKSLLGDAEEGETATGEGYIRNQSSVKTTLKQMKVPDKTDKNTFLELTEQGPKTVVLPPGTPFIQVRISRADSRQVVDRFLEVFRRLMNIYNEEKESIDSYYQVFVPNLYVPPVIPTPGTAVAPTPVKEGFIAPPTPVPNVCRTGPGAPPRKTGTTKIDYLKQLAPDLFVNKYARRCQCALQPLIVGPDEIEQWQARNFIYKGVENNRQVMPFPRDNPKYLFVCPDDKSPFPGVKLNKDLPNKDLYPYIPCCFTTDQMANPNSKYNQYYQGIKKEPVPQTRATHKIKGNKVLEPGRVGVIPKTINDLLQRYSDQANEFNRLGVPRSVNSLIHCILIGLNNPQYFALPSVEEREEFATRVRRHILGSTHPSLMKQELFDLTDDEIRNQIADPEVFYDPALFYRSLEELFNVNIYVFVPSGDQVDEEDLSGRLEIPRYKLFHSRPLRDKISVYLKKKKEEVIRPSIIIYKHYGASSDVLTYPQCELIVDYDDESKTSINHFGPSMTRLLHTTLLEVLKTITWTIENPPASPIENDLVARNNIYSQVDYYAIIGRNGTGQILDDYGKLRALVFKGPKGPLMMAIPSSQPENLPIVTDQINGDPNAVIDLFGEPTGITMTTNREVSGYWFQVMDLIFGIYIPVTLTQQFEEKVVGPPNPIFTIGTNVVERVQQMNRSLDFFWQLLKWLFITAQVTAPTAADGVRTPVLPDQFADLYFSVTKDQVLDSSTYYNFSRLERKLPILRSVAEGIALMRPIVPTMFSQNKIIFYSSGFELKIRRRLEEFYYLTSPLPITPIAPGLLGDDWKVPTEIENYYRDASDFRQQDAVAVFIGEKDFSSWLASISRPSYTSILIKNKLDISYGLLDEPYIYLDTNGKIYLIQNVQGGSFDRAISVASTWLAGRVNLGLSAEPYTGDLPVHVVYTISASSNLKISEDRSYGSPIYLQVLLYGEGIQLVREEGKLVFRREPGRAGENRRYAAILPLL